MHGAQVVACAAADRLPPVQGGQRRPPPVDWPSVAGRRWCSWHLHGFERDEYARVAARWLTGLVDALAGRVAVDRLFFVRYFDADGHHLRVRLGLDPARAAEGDDEARAGGVVGRLAEQCGLTAVAQSFELETARYGGAELLPSALDFFAVSSHAARDWLAEHATEPRPRQLSSILEVLLAQAVASARGLDELRERVDYFAGWREQAAVATAKGDQVFDQRPESHAAWLRARIDATLSSKGDRLIEGTLALAQTTRGLAGDERRAALGSQMHMTANRLGLLNAEESYLTRLLERSLARSLETDPEFGPELAVRLAHQAPSAGLEHWARLVPRESR